MSGIISSMMDKLKRFIKKVFSFNPIKKFKQFLLDRERDKFAREQAEKYINALNSIPWVKMWITPVDYPPFRKKRIGLAITTENEKTNPPRVIEFVSICSLYKFLENGMDLNFTGLFTPRRHESFLKSMNIPSYYGIRELEMKLELSGFLTRAKRCTI